MRCVIFVLLTLALVACGGTSPVAPTFPGVPIIQPSVAQATGTPATLTPRPLNALPMLSGFTCGAVEVRDNRVSNPADARAAEDCFWAAYQQCAINAGMAVRESTGATPYVDSTQGPAYISFIVGRTFMVIAANGDTCAVRASLAGGPYRRTQSGTSIIGPGASPGGETTCARMTRSANGDLRVDECGPSSTVYSISIPRP